MTTTHILGYPRIGEQRELKKSLESYWKKRSSLDELDKTARELRQRHWTQQDNAGLDYVTVGDFSYYDQVLDFSTLMGVIPSRFNWSNKSCHLDTYFNMARGFTLNDEPVAACEMTKWFDTNYHYIVPEFSVNQTFKLSSFRLFDEIKEAKALGLKPKVVLLGVLSFLWLGKCETEEFDKLALLEKLLPVYSELLVRIHAEGVEWVQIDEPILGLDLPLQWRVAFNSVYNKLQSSGPKKLLATYFSPILDNLQTVVNLPVEGLHIDAIRCENELDTVVSWLPKYKVLSVGIIDGRNIWKSDIEKISQKLMHLKSQLGDKLWVSASCSLLHVPVDLNLEENCHAEIKSWLAFAVQKLEELHALKKILNADVTDISEYLAENKKSIASRKISSLIHNSQVKSNVANISKAMENRQSVYSVRSKIQQERLKLPVYPTTTIGSFPQTKSIRAARLAHKCGDLSDAQYVMRMKQEIETVIQKQEQLGLDVFVHGEAERNDMVEYFGEQLQGFTFSEHGWVQSYGSRCVKPPIIFGDIYRDKPMTVEWSKYAQSLTKKPVKGMLTGPVTILNWSFVRDDQSRETSCLQIALAIRDEVMDLESAGIEMIQIDEAALREGMPLRRQAQSKYLNSAVSCFRVSASGVKDSTQIHTHMCYSEFNEIMDAISAMDADVITIECSRSNNALLKVFSDFNYPNQIGPGVYDIHSPNVPSTEAMVNVIKNAKQYIPSDKLWVNPDCGLKTRDWEEVEPALINMVNAARTLRQMSD